MSANKKLHKKEKRRGPYSILNDKRVLPQLTAPAYDELRAKVADLVREALGNKLSIYSHVTGDDEGDHHLPDRMTEGLLEVAAELVASAPSGCRAEHKAHASKYLVEAVALAIQGHHRKIEGVSAPEVKPPALPQLEGQIEYERFKALKPVFTRYYDELDYKTRRMVRAADPTGSTIMLLYALTAVQAAILRLSDNQKAREEIVIELQLALAGMVERGKFAIHGPDEHDDEDPDKGATPDAHQPVAPDRQLQGDPLETAPAEDDPRP